MKFRRVLVATALVAVLASSLFSGWLTGGIERVRASRNVSSAELQKWVKAIMDNGQGSLRILVPTDQNTPNPPYIAPTPDANGGGNFIPADPTVGRPQLQFRLVGVSFNGARATLDQKWLIFQGYGRNDSTGSFEPIDNFYYLVESGRFTSSGHQLQIIYDTDQANVFIGIFDAKNIEGGGAIIQGSGGLSIPDEDINKVFGYIMYVPQGNRAVNCDDSSGVYKTGPPGDGIEGKTVQEIQGKHPDTVTTNHPSNLHSNCGSKTGEGGWLDYWGASINFARSEDGGGSCGIGVITRLKDGVGEMVVTIFACIIENIIDGVFKPLEKITQGAGEQTGALECNLAGGGPGISQECRAKDENGNLTDQPPNPGFHDAWKFSLGLINVLVILALLVIAFANILHLNLNTYAAKKALPGLVIGVVGANASLLLIRFVLDVAKALQLFAFDIAQVDSTGKFVGAFMTKVGMTAFESSVINWASLGVIALIAIVIFAIYMFFLVFVFAWGMIKRLVYIYGLTVLAPLAFVSYGIPGQQQWFTKWWDMMLRQIFMLPVVFLGAAMLIRYINITVVPPNTTGDLDISNLINMALVFLTATAILKLPGLITKGAIDISGAAKKAFGMAKATPLRAVSSYQGGHEFFKGGGKQRLSAGFYRKLGLKDLANKRAELARENRLGYKKKYKGSLSWIKGARGYAKLVDDPNILLESYQERVKQSQKDDKIAALTKTHRIPGKLRGGAAEALLAKSLALDELKDARTEADVRAWREGLGSGHLGAVYNDKDLSKNLWRQIMMVASGGNEDLFDDPDTLKRAEALRQRFGAIGNEDDMINFIEGEVNWLDPTSGGLGTANQWNIHDLMKVSGLEKKTSDLAKQTRLIEEGKGKDPQDVALDKLTAFEQGENTRGLPYGGGGGSPSGGDGSGITPVKVVGGTIDKIGDIGLSPEEVGAATARLTNINQHAGALHDVVDKDFLNGLSREVNNPEILESMLGEQAETTKQMLSGLVNTTKSGSSELLSKISGAFADKTGEALQNIVHDMTIAANNRGDTAAMERHLANSIVAGQGLDAANQNAQAAFNPERQNELYQHIETGNESEIAEMLKSALTPTLTTLNQTLGKVSTPQANQQIFEQMAKELAGLRETLSGRGPRSFSRILETLGSRMGKQLDVAHLSMASQFKQAMASKPGSTAETPTTQTSEVKVSVENQPSSVAGTAQTIKEQAPETPVPSPEDQTKQ